MKKIVGQIIKAIDQYNLIKDGDKIAIGVSGGKDSITLLYCLSLIKDIFKKERDIDFSIEAIHVKMQLCAINYDHMYEWCKNKNINLHIEDSKINEILLSNKNKKGQIQCSLCAKLKKGILVEKLLQLKCNKLALGHHADDAIETLFMNMIFNGKIATFPPNMFLDRKKVNMIRPMIYVREADIIKEAKKLNLPMLNCGCPMDGYTQREVAKIFLKENFYDVYPTSYKNFLSMLHNSSPDDLWNTKKCKNEE